MLRRKNLNGGERRRILGKDLGKREAAMPRSVADAPLTTRAARERLAARHQPYWRGIEAGAAIGYRKGSTGGVWLVRLADPAAGGGYRQSTLGRADDALKAAGDEVLDYRQAESKAREWIARQHRVAAGLELERPAAPAAPYTVANAVADYLADYTARGGKAIATTRLAAGRGAHPARAGQAAGGTVDARDAEGVAPCDSRRPCPASCQARPNAAP
jgi:hypothetical protein